MGWLGLAMGGVGALTSMFAGNQQANAAKQAANQANNTLTNTYNGIRGDNTPYMNAGYGAVSQLSSDLQNGTGVAKPFNMSDFYNDPGYQFQLQQGNQAIERSAAARGGLLSGAAGKAIGQYTTNLANQTYGDAYNRYLQTRQLGYNQLAGVAGLGQNSINNVSNAGLSTGTNMANNTINALTGAANAKAGGLVGAVNSLAGGVGNYYMMNAINGGGSGGNPYGNLYQAQQLANSGGSMDYLNSPLTTMIGE